MKKRIISLFLAVAMIMASTINAFAYGVNSLQVDAFDYKTAYDWAVEVGFAKDFLDIIGNDAVRSIYLDNIDSDEYRVVGGATTLIEGEEQTRGNISSNHMTLYIYASEVNHIGLIDRLNVYVGFDWKSGRPLMQLTDAITVNWDSSIWNFGAGSFDFSLNAQDISVNPWGPENVVVETLNRPALSKQGGLGWYVNLRKLSVYQSQPNGYADFVLYPNNTGLKVGSDYSTSLNCIYGHKTIGVGISLSASGVSVSMTNENDSASDTYQVYYSK